MFKEITATYFVHLRNKLSVVVSSSELRHWRIDVELRCSGVAQWKNVGL